MFVNKEVRPGGMRYSILDNHTLSGPTLRTHQTRFSFYISDDLEYRLMVGKPSAIEFMIDFFSNDQEFFPEIYAEERYERAKYLVFSIWSQSKKAEFLVDGLPGLTTQVKYPCGCLLRNTESFVKLIIIHLNDIHKWTREAIADWLETLDIDMEFKNVD